MSLARAAALAACLAGMLPGLAVAGEPERLAIEIADTLGQRHVLEVEVARSPDARARGLMFRRQLPPDGGMLFVFPGAQPVRMWMRNTLLSLDLLFFDGSAELVAVFARCEPLSEQLIGPDVPVRAVLELPAGGAAHRSLVPGARLLAPAIGELTAR